MNLYSIKMKFKQNKYVDSLLRVIASPIFAVQYLKSEFSANKRQKGFNDPKYCWIKGQKNKYLGKRCFVVATGPSLTMDDLELIKNEFSFAMNSCILALDKTSWCPSFYAIQDENVYMMLENELKTKNSQYNFPICVSEIISKKFNVPKNFNIFPLHYLDHKMYHREMGKFKFSDDCYSAIYDGYSVIFSIMQLACYMGFKEIYLLGTDCNYNQPKEHFIESGHKDPKAAFVGDKLIKGHSIFKKFSDSLGVTVINCTRGGMLEVYPRKKLEDVVGER